MVVDFHTHVFPPSFRQQRQRYLERDRTFAALYSNPQARLATAQELIREMDAAAVDTAVVLGIGWTDPTVAQEANDAIIEAVRAYPHRLVGFCSVNPAWGEAAAREVERCARAGLRGVGELHPDTQGFDLADAKVMAPIMEVAQANNLVLLTHSSEPVGHSYTGKGSTTPQKLLAFILSFPQAVIVCAHWGGGLPFYALMPEVKESLKNTHFDCAASPFLYTPNVFPTVAGLVGAEKILFGSDFPLLRQQRLIQQIQSTALPSGAKEKILGLNAKALLGLP